MPITVSRNDSMQIFIVGSGRTGTNWIGKIVGYHPRVSYAGERLLGTVSKVAVLQPGEQRDAAVLRTIGLYRKNIQSVTKNYADKSHPALWIIDELAQAFPRARFIAMKRDPVAAVASMLKHRGVLRWNKLDHPSPFLGTTEDTFAEYQTLDEYEKCAIRLKAHYDRIDKAVKDWPERVMVVRFESLVRAIQVEIDVVNNWLGIGHSNVPYKLLPRGDTLTKWRSVLSEEQAEKIGEQINSIR